MIFVHVTSISLSLDKIIYIIFAHLVIDPSLSEMNTVNQQIAKQTPSFTSNNVRLGVF